MIGIFKSIFGEKDNSQLISAIDEGAYIVDVRSPVEFKGGSVKGAVNIPLDSVPNQLSKFKGKNGVVVFCQSGARSGVAKGILEKNGIQNVINGGGHSNMRKCIK
jgi:rhodanese-related sulfurtransferase